MRFVRLLLCMFVVAACGDNKPNPGQQDAGIDAPVDAPDVDAPVDAPDLPPAGIAEARATADGTGLDLAIQHVVVTYLKPELGNVTNDPAGFTIQRDPDGPALFVSVDPATLDPVPEVGDVVSFTITTMGTVGLQRRAQEIADYTRISQGANVAGLSQDVSAAIDLVTAVDNYDSELLNVTGTLATAFAASGSGFRRSQLDTAGISGEPNLQLRAPITLIDATDMVEGCTITVSNVPMSRFNAQAQIVVFAASDFTLSNCPAPVVESAAAISATQVRVTFSRNIDPASVTADGSQFTFDNGLVASAASVSGKTVTVTTNAQTPRDAYTVTVASTVTDLQGSGVAAPNSATFIGFVTPAVVRINEVNANIAQGCDLVELRVVSGGSMNGLRLTERTGGAGILNFTFPDFDVLTNAIIVVHLNATSATCNPNNATQETVTPLDQPALTFSGNFDTAFDFWIPVSGLVATTNVLILRNSANDIVDAVFLTNGTTAPAAATLTAAATVGAANQWDPAQAAYDANFHDVAVPGLGATGTTASGTSIQRLDNTDDNNRQDWTAAPAASSFGLLNPDQTPF
jgi:hypothetical protein